MLCGCAIKQKKIRKLDIGLRRVSGQGKGPDNWESGDGKGRRIGMEECSYSSNYLGPFHWVSLCRNAWVCGDIMGRLKREYDTK